MIILLLSLFFPFSEQYPFLSGYGEACGNYTACKDHRMVCNGEEDNKTCVCVKYHEWKGVDYGCVQKYDGEYIMRMELVFNNLTEGIARSQRSIFNLQLWAGVFVVVVYLVAVLSVVLFCIYIRSADLAMKNDLNALKMNIRRDTITRQKVSDV